MRKQIVLFFAIIFCVFTLVSADKTEKTEPNKSVVNYLIITTDTLEKSAEEYAKYRTSTGYETAIITVAECIKKFPDIEANEAIQKVILEYRDKAKLGSSDKLEADPLKLPENYKCPDFYVLLLGDITPEGTEFDVKSQIPGFYKEFKTDPGITGAGRNENVPSDNSYACRPTDDDVPTIAVGRLTFSTQKEVAEYLKAVRKYESEPPTGAWRRKVNIFAGDPRFQGVPKFVSNIIENIFKTGVLNNLGISYEGTLTYANVESPYAYAPTKFNEKLMSEINDGSLILNYVGHGWKTSVDRLYFNNERYPVFTVKDAKKVDCKDKLPIAAFFTCYTGCYDMEELSLAETLLANPKGPVGVIASSRISAEANYLLETAFFKAATIDREATLGKVFLKMKRYMLTETMPLAQLIKNFKLPISNLEGYAEGKRSHLWLYNLFGDPALKIAHPEIDCQINLAETTVTQGSEIKATIECTDAKQGKALITLECKLADFLEDPTKIKSDDKDFEAKAAKNHEIANNKIIEKTEVKLIDGKGEVIFKISADLKPRKYLIRALITTKNQTGFNAAEFEVVEKTD